MELVKQRKRQKFPIVVRKFAQRIHFYSAMAYNVVREEFAMPAPSTLRTWTSKIDAEPGWTSLSFVALEQLVSSMDKQLHVTLMMDGVAIKDQLLYDKNNDRILG